MATMRVSAHCKALCCAGDLIIAQNGEGGGRLPDLAPRRRPGPNDSFSPACFCTRAIGRRRDGRYPETACPGHAELSAAGRAFVRLLENPRPDPNRHRVGGKRCRPSEATRTTAA